MSEHEAFWQWFQGRYGNQPDPHDASHMADFRLWQAGCAWQRDLTTDEIETLRRSLAAAKRVIESKEAIQSVQSDKLKDMNEAISTLASEREANAVLTDEIETLRQRVKELEYEAGYTKPVDPGDNSYPNPIDVAACLRNCSEDLLTEARFVLWQGRELAALKQENERLVNRSALLSCVNGALRSDSEALAALKGVTPFNPNNAASNVQSGARQGEPVATVCTDRNGSIDGMSDEIDDLLPVGTPLYTAPQVQQGDPVLYQCTKCGGANYGCQCESLSGCTEPLYAAPQTTPDGWQLMDMGWLQATLHVNALRMHPEKSHEELTEAVNRVIAAAPKPKGTQTCMVDAQAKAAQVESTNAT